MRVGGAKIRPSPQIVQPTNTESSGIFEAFKQKLVSVFESSDQKTAKSEQELAAPAPFSSEHCDFHECRKILDDIPGLLQEELQTWTNDTLVMMRQQVDARMSLLQQRLGTISGKLMSVHTQLAD